MSNPAFAFPSGPAPHCPLKEGAPDTFLGILEDPTCPGIHSADSPFLILPWVCIGLALLLGAAHLVQRKWGEGGQAGDMDSELPTAKDPATAELANLVFSETLEVESFRRSYLGTGAKYSLFSFYLSLVYMYFIVILDVYIDCELNSWNAMCFFGSYPISGNYNRSSVILYSTWVVVLVTYSHLLIYKEVLPNWYRLPCKARDATHLAVKAPVMEKERHVFNPSSIVLAYRRITNFRKSDKVAIAWETIPVLTTEDGLKYVDYRCSRFVLKGEHYMKAELRLAGTAIGELASQTGGLASGRTRTLLQLVGPNAIPFDVDSYTTSICKEFGRFFYLYQFQMYIPYIWFSYQWAAMMSMSVCLLAGFINIRIMRQGQQTIATLTKQRTDCEVLRDSQWVTVDSSELAPGDVVRIKAHDWSLPADMLLLSGAVITNESGLTGESMPVRKFTAGSAEPGQAYDPHTHARNTLFAGTNVLQAKAEGEGEEVAAMVTATGIDTGKGELIASILYPKAMVFKYDEELPIIFIALGCYAAVVFVLAYIFLNNLENAPTPLTAFTYGLSTLTQTLNPLLPVALVAGNAVGSSRLFTKGVFCVDPKRISIAGKVRLAVFDKTGTITKDGLDFLGVRRCNSQKWDALLSPFAPSACNATILHGVASCHAVSLLGTRYVGLGVEVAMLEATGWQLEERPGALPSVCAPAADTLKAERISILRRFDFDHTTMTMSVIIQRQTDHITQAFCKGAPEKVGALCTKQSLPANFERVCAEYALKGMYVLALAYKEIDTEGAHSLKREQVESSLTFGALLLFRNEMKHDSPQALAMLRDGGVRSVMATGDNAQCAEYIARSSGLIGPNARVLLAKVERVAGEDIIRWCEPSNAAAKPLSTEKVLELVEEAQQIETDIALGEITTIVPEARDHSSISACKPKAPTELAIADSKAFAALRTAGVMERLRPHTRIWARTNPADKVLVLKLHMDAGLVCSMTGDGGNDCGALREAQAGLALSEAEASVVSPFTSGTGSLMSVVDLLREGRAALANSFGATKWLLAYGFYFSVLKLCCFYLGIIMSANAYILIDFSTIIIAGVMSFGPSLETLHPTRPTSSLTGPITLASLAGVQIFNVAFYLLQLFTLGSTAGFMPFPTGVTTSWYYLSDNWDCTAIFAGVYFPLLTCAATFSFGGVHRQPVWANKRLCATLIGGFTFASLLLLLPSNPVSMVFHIASEDFNSPCPQHCYQTYHDTGRTLATTSVSDFPYDVPGCETCPTSPVWLIFQQPESLGGPGGQSSPAMSFDVRLRVWLFALLECALLCVWEKIGVMGPVADYLKRRYPRQSFLTL